MEGEKGQAWSYGGRELLEKPGRGLERGDGRVENKEEGLMMDEDVIGMGVREEEEEEGKKRYT